MVSKNGRRLIKEGPSKYLDGKEVVECYLFLFNDLFLISKQRVGGILKKDGLELKGKVALDDLESRIYNLADNPSEGKKYLAL